jgi:hypothetical protein
MKYIVLLLSFLFSSLGPLQAQGSPLPTDDTDGYDLLRRLTLRYGYEGFERPATDLSLRPTNRGGLVRLAKTFQARYG